MICIERSPPYNQIAVGTAVVRELDFDHLLSSRLKRLARLAFAVIATLMLESVAKLAITRQLSTIIAIRLFIGGSSASPRWNWGG
ncbi:conserved protein of unknown function (plasmid) [Rhodovastum atsumiense]|uniref:Uncharacterized protein n=1 Tax=Rhodovastum atsumiense TaxID=504468 RepID=A0A5M6IJ31_9PROT|nr:hypothetical protein [Rhodovastum atsumiense]KAA5608132.1 hypothetical protein F1189_30550 [Rhodovastum atsumiense]CAH2605810.1 conserved protein of unknown function [Rhodovastum atsumiense]